MSFVVRKATKSAARLLRAYAEHGRACGYDEEYIASILELADDFDRYRGSGRDAIRAERIEKETR